MEVFVNFMFWYFLVVVFFRLILIATAQYPRTQECSLGSDVAALFIGTSLFVWIGLLYFGVIL